MPFTNFNNRHFSEAEKAAIDEIILSLEDQLTYKMANLSSDERARHGSVNEQNKLIINKVRDLRASQPELSSPDVDWEEFEKDYNSRVFLEKIIQHLQSLINGLSSAKILHDKDNYSAALTEYDYAKYKSTTQSIGYMTKVNELKQFFTKFRSGTTKPNIPPLEEKG